MIWIISFKDMEVEADNEEEAKTKAVEEVINGNLQVDNVEPW